MHCLLVLVLGHFKLSGMKMLVKGETGGNYEVSRTRYQTLTGVGVRVKTEGVFKGTNAKGGLVLRGHHSDSSRTEYHTTRP